MEFKVGQIWRTRGGDLREIVVSPYGDPSGAFPVSAVDVGTANPCYEYLATGRCYKSLESSDDLVELVRDVDGWIVWEGGECPVTDTTRVAVRFFNGKEPEARSACLWAWRHHRKAGYEIAAYKVVESVPEPEPEPASAAEPEPESKPEPFTIAGPGEYITRSGLKAVVTAVGLRCGYPTLGYPTLGYIVWEEYDSSEVWTGEGRYHSDQLPSGLDLVGRWNPYTNVAIDTPVWVRDEGDVEWAPRHFAGVRDRKPLAWSNGLTSHTVVDLQDSEPVMWDELSLTKPE